MVLSFYLTVAMVLPFYLAVAILFPLQLNKGTEITLKATPTTNILDIRGRLAQKTGIAKDSIQIRYRVSSGMYHGVQSAALPLPYQPLETP